MRLPVGHGCRDWSPSLVIDAEGSGWSTRSIWRLAGLQDARHHGASVWFSAWSLKQNEKKAHGYEHLKSMMENFYCWASQFCFAVRTRGRRARILHFRRAAFHRQRHHRAGSAPWATRAAQRVRCGAADAWRAPAGPVECCQDCRCRDVPFPRANDNEDCIAQIARLYGQIDAAGARPISVGGDHSITGGIIQALGLCARQGDQCATQVLMANSMQSGS